MIKNHIEAVLTKQLNFTPTDGQKQLISRLAAFIAPGAGNPVFIIKGYAGTGKTTMLALLVQLFNTLEINSVLLAPTGRAAKVLAGYTRKSAFTIHKKIYRQQSSSDGMGKFVLDKNLHKNTFFIVDEASMISNKPAENNNFGSGRVLDDLVEYAYSGENCRLILVGDTAQLPPVGVSLSPALELFEVEQYGFGAEEFELTEVVRQSKQSGILANATYMRTLISSGEAHTGFFPIDCQANEDVERVSGEELIEKISDYYDRYGIFETTVVTRSNKRANLYNKGIRNSILYREEEISKGDLLMVVKNNYYWASKNEELNFIANGDLAEIVSIHGFEELYGFRFADVCLKFVDYKDVEIDCKIFIDTLGIESASLQNDDYKRLFEAVSEDYMDIRNKQSRWKKIRENPYFNALQVKFGYAVTCHKAQGGQWKAVFIDHGYLTEEMINTDYLRWMYTAFTRPTEKLLLINFDKRFFEKS